MTVAGDSALSPRPRLSAGRLAANVAANMPLWIAALVRAPRRPRPGTRAASAWPLRAALGGAVIATIAAMMLWLDGTVYDALAARPLWLVLFFDAITDFGRSGWILVPAGIAILVLAALVSPALDRISRGVAAALVVRLGFVFVAVGLPGLIGTIVKRWIGRVRPSELGPLAYEPFSWRSEWASMPSGHTITAFSALVAIGLVWPRLRPLLWVYALVIAASRIVLTAHYPSDVIAGAAFGALGALLVRDWFAARRLGFHVAPDGRVRTRPVPSWARVRRLAAALIPLRRNMR